MHQILTYRSCYLHISFQARHRQRDPLAGSSSQNRCKVVSTRFKMMSFLASLSVTLTPVVLFSRTLRLPSTHASHPAATAILATLK